LDNIRKAYKTKSAPPPRKSKRKSKPQEDPFPAVYNEHLKALCNTILSQKWVPKKLGNSRFFNRLDCLLEGYSQIESLINEVDVILHLFKHDCADGLNPNNFYIFITQLVEVLEYEIEIFNSTVVKDKSCFATKYFLIEKLHIDNNKIHDLYSATKYPHRLFNLSFENPREKRVYITEGNKIKTDSNYVKNYYDKYLEESLKIEMETRYDYDSYLNELFPNHDQHIEYIILILYLLSQFCSNENIMKSIVDCSPDEESKSRSEAKLEIYKKRVSFWV